MLKEKIISDNSDSCNKCFPHPSKSFISNQKDILATYLTKNLIDPEKLSILRKIIIIPNSDIKDFLSEEISRHLDVSFGVRFLTLPQACMYFAKLTNRDLLSFPSHDNLLLHLEYLIKELIKSGSVTTQAVKKYVDDSHEKLLSLAEALSHVFLTYGTYGGDALKPWLERGGWQQLLFEKIQKKWAFPSSYTQQILPPKILLDIHVFDLSYIPPILRSYLSSLETYWPITYYVTAPTPNYWLDNVSEKTVAFLDAEFEKKKISSTERIDFENIATDTHLLLANLGQIARSTVGYCYEKEVKELFIPPTGDSNLAQLQRDIYNLQESIFETRDSSIQIEEAPSKKREVEVLLYNLQMFFKNHTSRANQVRVYVSDIDKYFPFIRLVFEGESPFGYVVSDISMLEISQVYKTLYRFFSLVDSRFEKEKIYDLFASPLFKEKQALSEEDLLFFRNILDEMNVQWGFDQKMKQEVLQESRISASGSFLFAFQELIKKLPFLESRIDLTKAELLGKLVGLVEKLYQDLSDLKDRDRTLQDWIKDLSSLVEQYFVANEEIETFTLELSRLYSIAVEVDSLYSFKTLKKILEEIFLRGSKTEYYSEKPIIRFSPIAEIDIVPVDAIFVLGLDEESFPRKTTIRSLNVLKNDPKSHPIATNAEKDRFFFLQCLLSAKKQVTFSYTSVSEDDQKSLGPSLLIKELLGYFNQPYIRKHPPFSFSKFYTEHLYFLEQDQRLAKAFYYGKEKKIESFLVQEKSPPSLHLIDVRNLLKLTKHPIQLYANQTLGIYLKKDSKEASHEREFLLSYLDRAMIRSASLFSSKEKLLDELERQNLLPSALFKEVAKEEILEEISSLENHLRELEISPNDFYHLTLDISATKPSFLSEKHLIIPAISHTIENRRYLIYGTLENLLHGGVLTQGKVEAKEIWKYLPHLLISAHLSEKSTSSLYSLKEGEKKEIPLYDLSCTWTTLLDYYDTALKTISPLMPEMIKPLLEDKKEMFATLLKTPNSLFTDPYLEFFTPNLSHNWEEYIKALCKSLTA